MRLTSRCFSDGEPIPARNAFGAPDAATRFRLSANRNPDLAWSGLPAGTKSLVLLCHDPDVPGQFDDANQEGRIIPAAMPRIDFYHWVLVDLPAHAAPIAEGEFSDCVTPRGKAGPGAPRGTRQGLNDFTVGFASEPQMSGEYFGYDGPCPPWNDQLVHRYVFSLYALDVETCPVSGIFRGPDVLRAIEGHVLGQAMLTGRYTLNPEIADGPEEIS